MLVLDLGSKRYVQLVQQLGDERGRRYGWRSEVARLLDVHPSYVSRIAAGEQTTIGRDAIERAIEHVGLPASYFAGVGPDDYRKHLQTFNSSGQPLARTDRTTGGFRVGRVRDEWDALDDAAQRFDGLASPTLEEATALAKHVLSIQLINDARVVLERAANGQDEDAIVWAQILPRGIRDTILALSAERTALNDES